MLCAYIPYFLSETLQLSGIVTCIFSGISCRRYLKKNLSKDAGVIMQLIFNITSHCAEVSCFLLLGLSVFHQKKEDVDVPFIIISFVLTLVARIIHVYPLVAMCNAHELCKKSSEDKQQLKTKIISCNAMTILVFGGLRGAVAYSCANIFPDNNGNRKLFLSTTTGVVLATIFFQGILIYPLILLLNVSSKQVDEGNLLKCGDDTIETINWEKKWIYPLVLGNDYPVYKDSRDARVQEDEISSAGGSFHTTKFHTLEGNEPLHSLKQEEECGDNIYNRDTVEETPFSDDDDDFYQPRKNVELTYENLQEHHKIWNFRGIL
jgi:NhaP-type Na+/H+ and K+/H+ antiporter